MKLDAVTRDLMASEARCDELNLMLEVISSYIYRSPHRSKLLFFLHSKDQNVAVGIEMGKLKNELMILHRKLQQASPSQPTFRLYTPAGTSKTTKVFILLYICT